MSIIPETQTDTPKLLPRIRVLPPDVVNKIAAGEVVERPASVVKELVENAIDAGANRIQIQASAGGRTLRIADNGCGMHPDDALLAFTNHATSKLSTAEELSHIATMGFRGEALASISAISVVTCITRTAEASQATKIVFSPTGQPQVYETGASPGTVFEVQDLFYNTPARLKFLKKPATELAHIEEIVQALALANPQIRFELTLQEKMVFQTDGQGDLRRTIETVFRLHNSVSWVPVHFEDTEAGFILHGVVSEPDIQKSTRRWMTSLINGRVVRCNILNKAVEAAFESLMPHSKYPFSVVTLQLPTGDVDVNVHPTKREVRYVSPNQVFSFVKQGIKRALEAQGISSLYAPTYPGTDTVSSTINSPTGNHFAGGHYPQYGSAIGFSTGLPRPVSGYSYGSAAPSPQGIQASLNFYRPVSESTQVNDSPQPTPSIKVIGQLFNTYILLETPQGLVVVDQHIASERTFFERFKHNTQLDQPETQGLLTATPITLTASQKALLSEKQAWFNAIGFGFQWVSDTQVALTSVPLLYLEKNQPEQWFEELLGQLEQTGEMAVNLDNLLATMACHSACRAGDVLDNSTMTAIINQWLACQLPWTCPHGRPIAHTIAADELNKFFHRPSLPVNAGTA